MDLLNYPDVFEALNTGQLAGLGIDVSHNKPLLGAVADSWQSMKESIEIPSMMSDIERNSIEVKQSVGFHKDIDIHEVSKDFLCC